MPFGESTASGRTGRIQHITVIYDADVSGVLEPKAPTVTGWVQQAWGHAWARSMQAAGVSWMLWYYVAVCCPPPPPPGEESELFAVEGHGGVCLSVLQGAPP